MKIAREKTATIILNEQEKQISWKSFIYPIRFNLGKLVNFLKVFGFYELNPGKTGGSRRKFVNDKKEVITNMHKPHPGNILKEYAIKDAIAFLKEKEHFKDEWYLRI